MLVMISCAVFVQSRVRDDVFFAGQFALEFAGVDPFPLDPDAIEKAAIEKTGGLVDFGDNAYVAR